jgi:hypothetical protein
VSGDDGDGDGDTDVDAVPIDPVAFYDRYGERE